LFLGIVDSFALVLVGLADMGVGFDLSLLFLILLSLLLPLFTAAHRSVVVVVELLALILLGLLLLEGVDGGVEFHAIASTVAVPWLVENVASPRVLYPAELTRKSLLVLDGVADVAVLWGCPNRAWRWCVIIRWGRVGFVGLCVAVEEGIRLVPVEWLLAAVRLWLWVKPVLGLSV
jgi:hypothetical protein